MKTIPLSCGPLLCVLGTLSLSAQPEGSLPAAAVVARGPHHRVWQRVVPQATSYGKTYFITNSYTELGVGLHYVENGQWVEAREQIEIVEGGAQARFGQHQVFWHANLNTDGAVDLTTSDGKRLRGHILGL